MQEIENSTIDLKLKRFIENYCTKPRKYCNFALEKNKHIFKELDFLQKPILKVLFRFIFKAFLRLYYII